MIKKEDIWKYEEPLHTLNLRLQKCGMLRLPLKFVKKLGINENYVFLFRIFNKKYFYSTSKLSKNVQKSGKNYQTTHYVIRLSKKVLDRSNFVLPSSVDVEIIKIVKIGNKLSKLNPNRLDLVDFIPNNKKFTLIDRIGNWITVYYRSNGSSSVLTLSRFIKVDELFCWNLGFYLAEGDKSTKYCFGISNSESYLVKMFKDFGEKYFGLKNSGWFCDVKVKSFCLGLDSYWENELGLTKNKIKIRKIKNKPPLSEYGNCCLRFHNKILGTLIVNLVYNMSFIKSLNNNFSFAFLRGLQAGDGTVMKKSGCIEMAISCQKRELNIANYLILKVCSKKPFIRKSHTCDKVWIIFHRGLVMAREYILNGHFKEHKSRRSKLIRLYKKFDPVELNYIKILKENGCSSKYIQDKFNRTHTSVDIMIKKLCKLGFVNFNNKKEFNGRRFYNSKNFYLTDLGNKYVENLSL